MTGYSEDQGDLFIIVTGAVLILTLKEGIINKKLVASNGSRNGRLSVLNRLLNTARSHMNTLQSIIVNQYDQ